ncbi:hypothetical protein DPX16_20712 [Anabarilius grahami]|uniref:Uncharacterized protein n=1 Tax=Anabarilius grahami TaxID=495550 RepID=A0A3N0YQ72_ANAGA|nr:hypothetical protein DPX16_20712 [Anabarilius grahami]
MMLLIIPYPLLLAHLTWHQETETEREEGDLLTYLNKMEERTEEAQHREKRRARELEERKTRQYQEIKERDEEARMREEEFRVKMTRRGEMRNEEMRREVAAREERFLSLMELLAK